MTTRTLRSALLLAAVLLPLAGGLCMACVTCAMADTGTGIATSSPCHQPAGPAAHAADDCCCDAGEGMAEPAVTLSPALMLTAAFDVAPASVAPAPPRAAVFDQERALGRPDRCALLCIYRI